MVGISSFTTNTTPPFTQNKGIITFKGDQDEADALLNALMEAEPTENAGDTIDFSMLKEESASFPANSTDRMPDFPEFETPQRTQNNSDLGSIGEALGKIPQGAQMVMNGIKDFMSDLKYKAEANKLMDEFNAAFDVSRKAIKKNTHRTKTAINVVRQGAKNKINDVRRMAEDHIQSLATQAANKAGSNSIITNEVVQLNGKAHHELRLEEDLVKANIDQKAGIGFEHANILQQAHLRQTENVGTPVVITENGIKIVRTSDECKEDLKRIINSDNERLSKILPQAKSDIIDAAKKGIVQLTSVEEKWADRLQVIIDQN